MVENGKVPRRTARQRVIMSARMSFNHNLSSFDVKLRDLSDTGARIRQIFPFPAPEFFQLTVTDPRSGRQTLYHCRTSWQRGDLIGAEFVDADTVRNADGKTHVVLRGKPREP
ncbi:MAG: PilZ domain-containing protein [Hyphomonas sp.]